MDEQLVPAQLPEHIARSLRKLRKRSMVREAVELLTSGQTLNHEHRKEIINCATLGHGNWHERLVSIWALGRLSASPEQRRAYTQSLLTHIRQDDFDRSYCCGCGLFAGSCIFLPLMLLIPLFLPLALLPIWKGISENGVNQLRAEAIASLGNLSDPGAIRDVALAMWRPDGARTSPGDKRIREAAEAAFPILADTLTPDMYGRMHDETIKVLCRALYHPSMTVKRSALKAIKHVAGGAAIKAVEALNKVERSPFWPKAPDEIEVEIQETLDVLRARQANERAAASLLRPVDAPKHADRYLLRPLENQSEAHPERLLRPAEAGEDDHPEQSQENRA